MLHPVQHLPDWRDLMSSLTRSTCEEPVCHAHSAPCCKPLCPTGSWGLVGQMLKQEKVFYTVTSRHAELYHSWLGSLGQLMGAMVAASTFGDLFWSSSASSSLMRSPWDLLR